MATWIPKTAIRTTKNQNVYTAGHAIQNHRECSTQPRIIKNPTTASLKRGTGGRSSFNGIVCTVFGCNGFIGNVLCNRLGKIGTQLILPYRGDRYNVLPLKLCGDLGQVLFHPFHLKDETSILKCIKYSNVVVNLIGSDTETRNFDYETVHVEGARRLARLAKEVGVERFVHVSCLNADPNPEPRLLRNGSRILKMKWLGECAVREEFPNATIVRPSDVYGQGDYFLSHYMNPLRRSLRQIPLWEKGKKTEKQPIYVSDVGAGLVAVITNPLTAGNTYQFVGSKRYTLYEIVKWFYELAAQGQPQWIYPVSNLKHNPQFNIKITLNETIYPILPAVRLSWEILEKHHATDNIVPGLPTLEDLGITPVNMETRIPWEIAPYKHN
ncbi:PREDICTED: NADH dehydrogenase [ubiquinone] 1 alpha subcomplex subunit 9, mitochondrial [Dufourea novaeangliae]|uniref:NADH dehydrogenase [ubiquinone] 1 alpha subcomplex subunit 9, mitochondrial n=1 Tax=Dufourea novaeangliae TaxID=178035 RepID=UPI000767AEDF|nr:PREDICTED: NADH dehydrogenase [ubiquinone] 1 alpha subcomplex subunit 9, mitochondrial [Dufourea novaeangliae]